MRIKSEYFGGHDKQNLQKISGFVLGALNADQYPGNIFQE